MDAFIELDVNPAKVVALYPESVSGRLRVPPEQWIPMFGGPEPKPAEKKAQDRRASVHEAQQSAGRSPSPSGSMRSILPLRKGTLDAILPASVSAALDKDKEDDRASVRSRVTSQNVGQKKGKTGGKQR